MAVIFTLYVGFAIEGRSDADKFRCIDHNRAILFCLLHDHDFDGFTVYEGVGCYGGKEEPSASVVFIAPDKEAAVELGLSVITVAAKYKKEAQQVEVWMTRREEELMVL